MKLIGGIYFNEDGLSTSIRGMHLQTELLATVDENINNFGKVGYQKKIPVVSSFSELIGVHAYSETTDSRVGRLRRTKNPLDLSLAKEGYFQYMTTEGIKLTRDGRFRVDKNGYLTTIENYKVLSDTGQPIKFHPVPQDYKDVKVKTSGSIAVFNPDTKEFQNCGKLSVVSAKGSILKEVEVRQGYVEDSNVILQNEFFSLVPVRRNFEANRQMYIIQNDELSRTIQELSRTS